MNTWTKILVITLALVLVPNIMIGACISKEPALPTERRLQNGQDPPKKQHGSNEKDPRHLTEIAKKMVQVREPLPTGWCLASGIDQSDKKSVTFENQLNGASLTLTRYPAGVVQSHYVYYGDLTKAEIGGVDVDVDTRGFTSIGGSPIVYVRGHIARHQNSRHVAVEMAHVRLENGDVIIIEAKQPEQTDFDPSATKPMYKAIDGFALRVDPLRVNEYE